MGRRRRRRRKESRLTGLLIIVGFIIGALLLERAGCVEKPPKADTRYGTNTGTHVDEPAPTIRIGANGSTTVAA